LLSIKTHRAIVIQNRTIFILSLKLNDYDLEAIIEGNGSFSDCPNGTPKNCYFTQNRTFLGPHNEHKFDAILYQMIAFYTDPKQIKEMKKLKRSPNQRYIMKLNESPREPGFIPQELSR
jgi:hypothetical protein